MDLGLQPARLNIPLRTLGQDLGGESVAPGRLAEGTHGSGARSKREARRIRRAIRAGGD
ncbi:hypothetical protein Msil_3249 [Methylocella silvestris BL2]|uniref:Uncharacterized protein n=1 Tax=Methylocella silvestris (strain DSM 15510 / CIP 108128 / LMG 27833 / NCIMB 13906 / BL2) TaxID=395965 RepID=B8EQE3_METSB|nr:hypothetical protein Msil_3249 [Methylocella silvestris BL2]